MVARTTPAKTLAELIAKAKTEKLSYGSAGPGTTMHIAGEMLNAAAGSKITHVPYRGVAPALNDLMGGHIDLLNADLPVLLPLVKSGKLRALAMYGTERSPLLPDVPTSDELGYPGCSWRTGTACSVRRVLPMNPGHAGEGRARRSAFAGDRQAACRRRRAGRGRRQTFCRNTCARRCLLGTGTAEARRQR